MRDTVRKWDYVMKLVGIKLSLYAQGFQEKTYWKN